MRELQRAASAAKDAVEGALHAIREAAKQAERLENAALEAEEAARAGEGPDVDWSLIGRAEDLKRVLDDLVDDAINAKRHAIRAHRAAA